MRGSSRLKMELSGIKYTEQDIIQARIADTLSLLLWTKTKDAEHGRNKPESLVEIMTGKNKEKEEEFCSDVFDSPEEFWKARERALNKEK